MNYYTRQTHSLFINGECASALKCRDYKDFTDIIQEEPIVYDGSQITSKVNVQNPQPGDPAPTLNTDSRRYITGKKYVLRRLTPVECARLQGFPDWWCDGAEGSDSAQYKLWGNGIALPCAVDVIGRIVEEMTQIISDD